MSLFSGIRLAFLASSPMTTSAGSPDREAHWHTSPEVTLRSTMLVSRLFHCRFSPKTDNPAPFLHGALVVFIFVVVVSIQSSVNVKSLS